MRAKGYSLPEMMVSLAVVMLIVSAGVPAFQSLVRDAGVSGLVSQYLHAFNSARYAAVAAWRPVSICNLDQDGVCTGRWTNRLTTFYDDDRDGRLLSSADLIDQVELKAAADVAVSFRAFGQKRFVHLRRSGHYRQNGTFRICPPRGDSGRAIVINVAGRARTEKIRCT